MKFNWFKGDSEDTNLLMKAALSGNPEIVRMVLKKITEDAKGDEISIQVNKTSKNFLNENMIFKTFNAFNICTFKIFFNLICSYDA